MKFHYSKIAPTAAAICLTFAILLSFFSFREDKPSKKQVLDSSPKSSSQTKSLNSLRSTRGSLLDKKNSALKRSNAKTSLIQRVSAGQTPEQRKRLKQAFLKINEHAGFNQKEKEKAVQALSRFYLELDDNNARMEDPEDLYQTEDLSTELLLDVVFQDALFAEAELEDTQ